MHWTLRVSNLQPLHRAQLGHLWWPHCQHLSVFEVAQHWQQSCHTCLIGSWWRSPLLKGPNFARVEPSLTGDTSSTSTWTRTVRNLGAWGQVGPRIVTIDDAWSSDATSSRGALVEGLIVWLAFYGRPSWLWQCGICNKVWCLENSKH